MTKLPETARCQRDSTVTMSIEAICGMSVPEPRSWRSRIYNRWFAVRPIPHERLGVYIHFRAARNARRDRASLQYFQVCVEPLQPAKRQKESVEASLTSLK